MRDVYSIGLRTIITEADESWGITLSSSLLPLLISSSSFVSTNFQEEIARECLDILNDLIKKFGKYLSTYHKQLMDLFMKQLSYRPAGIQPVGLSALRKRSIQCLAALASVSDEELLDNFIFLVLDCILELMGGSEEKNVSLEIRTMIQAIGSVTRVVGSRLAKFSTLLVPLFLTFCHSPHISSPNLNERHKKLVTFIKKSKQEFTEGKFSSYSGMNKILEDDKMVEEDEDTEEEEAKENIEIRETCFFALESILNNKSNEINEEMISDILSTSLQFSSYDPNFCDLEEDGDEMDEVYEDDEEYEEDDYGNLSEEEDDENWRIRKASIKIINKIFLNFSLKINSENLTRYFTTMLKNIKRERDDSIKVDLIDSYKKILEIYLENEEKNELFPQNELISLLQEYFKKFLAIIFSILNDNKVKKTKKLSYNLKVQHEIILSLLAILTASLNSTLSSSCFNSIFEEYLVSIFQFSYLILMEKHQNLRHNVIQLLTLISSSLISSTSLKNYNNFLLNISLTIISGEKINIKILDESPSKLFSSSISSIYYVKNDWYKIIAEAQRLVTSILPLIQQDQSESFQQEFLQNINKKMFFILYDKLLLNDIDIETQEVSINSFTNYLSYYGDLLISLNNPEINSMLISSYENLTKKLSSELLRNYVLKGLDIMFKSTKSLNYSSFFNPEATTYFITLLKNNNTNISFLTLNTLISLINNSSNFITDRFLLDYIDVMNNIKDKDLKLTLHFCFFYSSLINFYISSSSTPSSSLIDSLLSTIYPSSLYILKSINFFNDESDFEPLTSLFFSFVKLDKWTKDQGISSNLNIDISYEGNSASFLEIIEENSENSNNVSLDTSSSNSLYKIHTVAKVHASLSFQVLSADALSTYFNSLIDNLNNNSISSINKFIYYVYLIGELSKNFDVSTLNINIFTLLTSFLSSSSPISSLLSINNNKENLKSSLLFTLKEVMLKNWLVYYKEFISQIYFYVNSKKNNNKEEEENHIEYFTFLLLLLRDILIHFSLSTPFITNQFDNHLIFPKTLEEVLDFTTFSSTFSSTPTSNNIVNILSYSLPWILTSLSCGFAISQENSHLEEYFYAYTSESLRLISSECLGLLFSLSPYRVSSLLASLLITFLPSFKEKAQEEKKDNQPHQFALKAWTNSIRYLLAKNYHESHGDLTLNSLPYLTHLHELLNNNIILLLNLDDIEIKKNVLIMTQIILHHSSFLIDDKINEIVLILTNILQLKSIRTVDLGPIKHKIDDYLSLRIVSITIIELLIKKSIYNINQHEEVWVTLTPILLSDSDDVKSVFLLILPKLFDALPLPFLNIIDKLSVLFDKIFDSYIKALNPTVSTDANNAVGSDKLTVLQSLTRSSLYSLLILSNKTLGSNHPNLKLFNDWTQKLMTSPGLVPLIKNLTMENN